MSESIGPLLTVFSTMVSAALTAAGLGIWIMRQFDHQRHTFYHALEVQRGAFEGKVDAHEALDQTRHEDNLKEFKEISKTLVRLEYNGRKHVS